MLRIRDLFARPIPPGAVLRCPRCTATYSADMRDYWFEHGNPRLEAIALRCTTCKGRGPGVALQLVTIHERIEVHAR